MEWSYVRQIRGRSANQTPASMDSSPLTADTSQALSPPSTTTPALMDYRAAVLGTPLRAPDAPMASYMNFTVPAHTPEPTPSITPATVDSGGSDGLSFVLK